MFADVGEPDPVAGEIGIFARREAARGDAAAVHHPPEFIVGMRIIGPVACRARSRRRPAHDETEAGNQDVGKDEACQTALT
jgi:hypothetical protein